MTHPVSLLFGVHAHQPVGNFPAVLDDAHERCYRPFIRTLHRYPRFRFAVHVSGWLLGYLAQRFPEDVALLREMVSRGQVELFGGGDYEPVLAAIPPRDRVGQLDRLSARLQATLGAAPHGAWLTERVWESSVVPGLVQSGVRYVTVDDYHFLCAGRSDAELDGHYSTEEGGVRLDLYPISEALRYRIPFAPANEVVDYIAGLGRRPHAAAVYFDDIEKFGIWPQTHEWVYGRRWLEQFIEGVLASPAIEAGLYRDHHARAPTRGVIYLPTTSYIEMNEWTLPAEPAATFAGMVDEAKSDGRYGERKPFIRGGIWRNFLSRYAESNWMHKRMLGLSERVAALPAGAVSDGQTDELYRAQANDAYWHGLFGGLYLPHLRRALWHSIARLEASLPPLPPCDRADLDLDGSDEIFLRTSEALAVVRVDADAAVIELTSYRLMHNFGDTLRRYREHYFRRIEAAERSTHDGNGIASPHDRIEFKHAIAPADLAEDARGRHLFLDTVTPVGGAAVAPVYAQVEGQPAAFAARVAGRELQKAIALTGGELRVAYRFAPGPVLRFSTELNLAMPSCDGFGGRYTVEGRHPGGFGQSIALDAVTCIALEDSELSGAIELTASTPVRLRAAPHHTVSQSEAGFEKIMQCACVALEWTVAAAAQEIVLCLRVTGAARGG